MSRRILRFDVIEDKNESNDISSPLQRARKWALSIIDEVKSYTSPSKPEPGTGYSTQASNHDDLMHDGGRNRTSKSPTTTRSSERTSKTISVERNDLNLVVTDNTIMEEQDKKNDSDALSKNGLDREPIASFRPNKPYSIQQTYQKEIFTEQDRPISVQQQQRPLSIQEQQQQRPISVQQQRPTSVQQQQQRPISVQQQQQRPTSVQQQQQRPISVQEQQQRPISVQQQRPTSVQQQQQNRPTSMLPPQQETSNQMMNSSVVESSSEEGNHQQLKKLSERMSKNITHISNRISSGFDEKNKRKSERNSIVIQTTGSDNPNFKIADSFEEKPPVPLTKPTIVFEDVVAPPKPAKPEHLFEDVDDVAVIYRQISFGLNKEFEIIRQREFFYYGKISALPEPINSKIRIDNLSTMKSSAVQSLQNMKENAQGAVMNLKEGNFKEIARQIFNQKKNSRPGQNDNLLDVDVAELHRIQETRRDSRATSSWAMWQLVRSNHDRPGVHWSGDQKHPYFCYFIVFLTFVILLAEIGNNSGFNVQNLSENPTIGPSKQVLLDMGAKRADLIINGQIGRLISAWFLHAGIVHWVVNMIALRNLGFSLEREFGTPKAALIYCWSGFAGVLTSCVFLPNIVGVGASGAIFGLFGAAWADLIQNWGIYEYRKQNRKMLRQLVIGTILNILLGLIPIIDQFSHLGGLFTGMFLGFYLLLQTRYTRQGVEKKFRSRHLALRSFGLAISIVAPITMLIILFTQVNPEAKWCEWCQDVNCAPIPSLWFCDASGCSDDLSVKGLQYPNGTIVVTCPSFIGRDVKGFLRTPATITDMYNICRDKCFV